MRYHYQRPNRRRTSRSRGVRVGGTRRDHPGAEGSEGRERNPFEDIMNIVHHREAPTTWTLSRDRSVSPTESTHSAQSAHSSLSAESIQSESIEFSRYGRYGQYGRYARGNRSGDTAYWSNYRSLSMETKFKYHYNLLLWMRWPSQYDRIWHDAAISAMLTTLWCVANMALWGWRSHGERERVLHDLMLFLFAMLMIHKDLILCNGQSCMPMLLLLLFAVRMLIEFVVHFELSLHGVNGMAILCILLFTASRFVFGCWTPMDRHEVHWNLMRCHFFYRGDFVRWSCFAMYCWFSSLMILELMDALCIETNIDVHSKQPSPCNAPKIKFVSCDAIIVLYGGITLFLWNRLQKLDMRRFRESGSLYLYYDLSVDCHALKESLLFAVVFIAVYGLRETLLTDFVVKKTVLPFTVIAVLIFNFLVR